MKRTRWLAHLLPVRRWRIVMRVDEGDLIPQRLPKRGAAMAGPPGVPKWLALDCPCGLGHRIMVNLDRRRRPVWRLVKAMPLTVRPSVDVIHADSRCHFMITNGMIQWVRPARKSRRNSEQRFRGVRDHD